jgi:tetratricopeptide (TPR) repeat protein
MGEGACRARLADSGVDARAHLEAAIALFQQAAAIVGEGPDFAHCLMNEGSARHRLAELGVEARANLEAAIALYRRASAIFEMGPDFAHCLMGEGLARRRLAKLGVDPRANLQAAIALYQQAGQGHGLVGGHFPQIYPDRGGLIYPDRAGETGPDLAHCLMSEAACRARLAASGVDARANLEAAVALHRQAGKIVARCLVKQAKGMPFGAVMLGRNVQPYLEAAIAQYRRAGAIFESGPDFADCLIEEEKARRWLAKLGVEAQANLETAADLHRRAGAIIEKEMEAKDAELARYRAIPRHDETR